MLIRPNLAAIVAIAGISVIVPVALGVQLRDGTVSFVQQPRLVATTTSIQDTNAWGATYYFTIDLPQNAGEPLQTVTFNQHEGVDNIRFDLKDTRAFVGTPPRRQFLLTKAVLFKASTLVNIIAAATNSIRLKFQKIR